VCITLAVSCASSRLESTETTAPKEVRTSPLPAGRLKLSFVPVTPPSSLEMLSVEEAQVVLAVFHGGFLADRPEIRFVPQAQFRLLDESSGKTWGQPLRDRFLSRFGATLLPLPEALDQGRFYQALKRSPRYMGAGVRDAARELFNSPVFLASVCLSVAVYFGAWLVPEPLFSKAFAVTLTAALALTVGMVEVVNLALACLRLYREAEAARTDKEMKAASAHFGQAIGGTALRVMVMVASMGVAKTVPTLPAGGLGALLGEPLYAVEGGLAIGSVATGQVVADGSLILSGVATGEVAAQLCRGLAVCATMDAGGRGAAEGTTPSTRYGAPHTRQNLPHNEAIEEELAAREAAGHTDLRKNKAQLNAQGKRLYDEEAVRGPRFRKPDVASLRPDGVRHNTNYVSNVRDLKRELEAFEAMKAVDPEAIHELYLLDGTLIRRYVPAGLDFP
jgi:hypothetical protein